MSGKANCYDDDPMERFWGTLKQEVVHHCHFRTKQKAKQGLTQYIEIFSNWQLLHSNSLRNYE
jgi:putative transposase